MNDTFLEDFMIKKNIIIVIILCTVFLLFGCTLKIQENQSTVTVTGIGTVLVQPDMVQMSISYSYLAQTTREAKEEVDKRIQQILDILKAEKIEDANIRTVSLSYDLEYDYREGRTIIIGQRAQQTIVVSINDIVNNPDRFPLILDRITAIDRVAIRNISFDTENKTELFVQSRELAYQKALDKANQYAALSGRKIDKVLSISEERSRDVYSYPMAQSNVAFEAAGYRGASSVPAGEQEVTTEITITFILK